MGTRGDCDLMVRALARTLEPIHELHVLLNQSGLMPCGDRPLVPGDDEGVALLRPARIAARATREGGLEYLIVYPMWKKREWYGLTAEERMRVMQDHIAVARRFTGIETSTAYSFGLDDQEFVVAFDADDPAEFLDLVQELRSTESSAYTESETPIFTCIAASVERALDALDGERAAPAAEDLPESGSGRRRSRARGLQQLLEAAQLHRGRPWGSPASFSARSIASQPA